MAVLLLAIATTACGSGSAQSNAPATTARTEPVQSTGALPAAPAGLTVVWTATEGIDAPESVYFDPASGFIFSSQVVGPPDARDGNGRIVKLDRDGKVIAPNWVTGLDAPKGLRACQGTLWTADLDQMVAMDVATGRITSRVPIAGAKFLNDVDCTADGTVYVSDMIGDRIYAVRQGRATVFAEGEQLEFPNGLLLDGNRLVVGGWGATKTATTADVPGHLFALDLKTATKTLITAAPFAHIDGIESDGHGGYLVSDPVAQKLYTVSGRGEISIRAQFTPGATDIGTIPAAGLLLAPHMGASKLVAYRLESLQRP